MNLATVAAVMDDYFHTMRSRCCAAAFPRAQTHGSQLAVIVNHKLAQQYWPGQDPIGKRMRIGTHQMKTPWMTVVGEIADVKLDSPDEETKNQSFFLRIRSRIRWDHWLGRRSQRQWRLHRAAFVIAAGTNGECCGLLCARSIRNWR